MVYEKHEKEVLLAQFYASGLTVTAAARELPGFPYRSTLAGWIKDHEAGLLEVEEIRVRGRVAGHARHTPYPDETKREAKRLIESGMGAAGVARRLHVPRGAVASWVRKLRRGDTIFGAMGGDGSARRTEEDGRVDIGDIRPAGELPAWADVPEGLPPEEEARLLREKLALSVAVLDVLKSPDPTSLTNREKHLVGTRAKEMGCRVSTAREALGIAESTYHAQAAIGARPDKYAALRGRVAWEFERSGRRYGAESIWAGMRRAAGAAVRAADLAEGDTDSAVIVSEKVVRRIMAEEGLVPVTAGRSRQGSYSSYAGEVDERPANLPLGEHGKHDFHAPAPGELLVTDVTEFKLRDCKAYLSPMIDCHDGCPVAWTVSRHPDAELTCSMLREAIRRIGHGFTCHTDGGGCYRGTEWKGLCAEHGVTRSMSRKGASGDNARAEGFFGLLKREFFHCRDWSAVGYDEFVEELEGYMLWYRDEKIKKSLGWMSIREYRESKGWVA